jgi:hypothetical protein
MTNPNAPRSLTRVWGGVLVVVVLTLILYTINRLKSAPVETRTDSIPAATRQE